MRKDGKCFSSSEGRAHSVIGARNLAQELRGKKNAQKKDHQTTLYTGKRAATGRSDNYQHLFPLGRIRGGGESPFSVCGGAGQRKSLSTTNKILLNLKGGGATKYRIQPIKKSPCVESPSQRGENGVVGVGGENLQKGRGGKNVRIQKKSRGGIVLPADKRRLALLRSLLNSDSSPEREKKKNNPYSQDLTNQKGKARFRKILTWGWGGGASRPGAKSVLCLGEGSLGPATLVNRQRKCCFDGHKRAN